MTARWTEVVNLFERALERPAEEREQFLTTAANGDEELRKQVAAMLEADSSPSSLLDATPDGLTTTFLKDTGPDRVGQKVGSYVIVNEIGRGGAATVYLATDVKHHRSVALKLLNADASFALGGGRFRREIDVVAQLQHPHILPLYDSGEMDGLLYYVMPLVSGETLRDRIARDGQLPIDDVRRIAADVGAALDYAHHRGVIHRDIKPANILLDEAHAVIADFGIAHRVVDDGADQLTATGVVIGTPAYMSPEQCTGAREIDARSDVYALGCVLFEMLTGAPPFRAASAVTLVAQHLQGTVPSARALRPELSPRVDDVFSQALAKEPADRFASVRDLVRALNDALALGRVSDAPAATTPVRPAPHRRSRPRWLAAPVLLVIITGLSVWQLAGRRTVGPPSIAVLPFVNMSGDSTNEYFSDGVTEEITGALAQLGRVHVTPRTTAFAYKGRAGDLRQIGAELGVSRILEGSVRRDAHRVLVHARLYDAKTGVQVWTRRFERDWRSVLALQTEIAGAIAEELELNLLPRERASLAERHGANADAYDSYLLGRHFYDLRTASSLDQAVSHFTRALEIDSTYARAHAGLADTYSLLAWTGSAPPSETFRLAEREARRALALDSTLAEAHLSLAIIHTLHTWDWSEAERANARAIALDSTMAQAWFWRTWQSVARGRLEEAMASIQRARALDPLSLLINARIGTLFTWWSDRYVEADSVLRRTLEIDPSYPVARVQRARVLSLQGRHAEAIAALPPDEVRLGSYESGIAGFVYARAGRRDAAVAAARALEARASVPAEGVAAIYAALGDRDAALRWLERAVESRGVGLIFVAVEPMYDSLRDDPRYERIIARVGLRAP